MPRIIELPRDVAELIAAGEVVERPASVVKELIENSIDAGADHITVEIENGGVARIRVTDDGCGIAPDDVATAFLRHATSKIKSADDLYNICTLGFRGEALAAIAAVSKTELYTKRKGELCGTAVSFHGGQLRSVADAGCPEGTTIVVSELFFNTPARMKFLKRDAAEAAACAAAAERAALSHPGVSVRLIKDGKTVLHTTGDGSLRSALYAVFGGELVGGLVEVSAERDGISVRGMVSKPEYSRSNRAMQFFFVNSRFVRTGIMRVAAEEAYRDRIMTGRHPVLVLFIDLNPALLDVNVHPAKTEVKFSGEKNVFDAVYMAVRGALDGDTDKVSPPGFQAHVPREDHLTKEQLILRETPPAGHGGIYPWQLHTDDRPMNLSSQSAAELYSAISGYAAENGVSFPPEDSGLIQRPPSDDTAGLKDAGAGYTIVGSVLGTYIVVDDGEGILFIDKHAAHERILYNRLLAQKGHVLRQRLLTPEVITVASDEAARIEEGLSDFAAAGFELEPFGENSFIVREAPDYIDFADIRATVGEISQKLAEGKRPGAQAQDDMFHIIACKAAVKAGSKNAPEEISSLVKDVMSMPDVKYCPHGRPVAVYITRYHMEKLFKRAT